jgi:hypothetical protein
MTNKQQVQRQAYNNSDESGSRKQYRSKPCRSMLKM